MTQKILDRSRPRISVQDFTLEQIQVFLRDKLAHNRSIHEAWLFGSLATQTATPWSDLDVVVIKPSEQAFIERPREFFDLFDLGIPIDLLVYTPEEFAQLRCSDSPFWRRFEQQKLRII